MYHEFLETLNDDGRVSKRVHEVISLYQKHGIYGNHQSILDLDCTKSINILMTVDNINHAVKLFVLSNGKVLRYDYKQNEIYEVEGLEDMEILEIKVLDMGRRERYIIMTEDGVSVCTMRENEYETGTINRHKQEQKHEMIEEEEQFIKTISCELSGSVFINPPSELQENNNNHNNNVDNNNDEDEEQENNPLSTLTRHRQIFIINNNQKNSSIIKSNNNNDSDSAIVIVINEAAWGTWYELMAYYIEVEQEEESNVVSNENCNHKQESPSLTIHPLKLPNNNYSMSLLLTDIDINLLTKQNQHINEIELKDSNFKYTRAHPIIRVDSFFSINNTFSIYFATQCVTDMFEVEDYRHRVFEFVIKIEVEGEEEMKEPMIEEESENHQLKINKTFEQKKTTTLSSTSTYEFTQNNNKKKVIHPYRVFLLPLINESMILSYFNITKHIITNKTHNTNESPLLLSSPTHNISNLEAYNIYEQITKEEEVITLSAVIKLQENRILFISANINLNISVYKESTYDNNHEFKFYVNEENLSSCMRVLSLLFPNSSSMSKFTLREVLLFDAVKNYAILLVNKGAVRIFPNQQEEYHHEHEEEEQNNNLFIVIVNLTPNLPAYQNRLVSCYKLEGEFNDSICELELYSLTPTVYNSKLGVDNHSNITQPLYKVLTEKETQINLHKRISITNSKINKKTNSNITKTLTLIPKLTIYEEMLEKIINQKDENTNNNKESLSNIRSESNVNYESFVENVVKLLAV